MKTKINVNGDIHIPNIMKKNLGLRNNGEVNIECTKGRIIITPNDKMRTREEVKQFLADIQNMNDDISKGMKAMAEWVLYEDYKSLEEE